MGGLAAGETRQPVRGRARNQDLCTTANPASTRSRTIPSTWSSFPEALAAFESGGYDGLGFCFTPPYVGIDLDGCRSNETNEPWAEEIIRELDSYSELSPSGRGVHVIVRGELPDGRRQKEFEGEHHCEGLYDASRGRSCTMTGARLTGHGTIAERSQELRRIHARLFPPEPKAKAKAKAEAGAAVADDVLIQRARKANDGGKFSRLWDGKWAGEYASPSEADLALCTKLAFWTGKDAARIDALFRRSGLMREKWIRDDYRNLTIQTALAKQNETYQGGKRKHAFSARINLDAIHPTIEALNGLDIFGGRIQFVDISRRGPMIVADFADDAEAVFHTLTDLTSFARAQVILAQATQVLIPTPARQNIKTEWEPAVQLILKLAGKDQTMNADKLREEFREILRIAWERAKYPCTKDDSEFLAMLRLCYSNKRDPQGPPPACAVWHDQAHCYSHQMSFMNWLSTPGGRNKHYDWGEVQNAYLLLDFVPKQVHRSVNNQHAKVRLWRGPLDLLIDDESGE